MKRNLIIPSIVLLLIALIMSAATTVFALPIESQVLQNDLPQITFLGQGPQTFTVEPPLKLLVKTYQNGQFLFVAHDEPEYTAKANERVWTIDVVPDEPIRLFDEEKSFGNVVAGCVINYVQIEDNIDTRRNTFYINGNVLQVVEQGWVTYGSFTVPEDGELTFFAQDSIGMVIQLCQTAQTVVPSESPTATSTAPGIVISPTATPTGTLTPPVVITPTNSETPVTGPTESLTPTSTSTAPGVQISLTPTSTSTAPGVQISLTPTSTSTAPGVQISLTPTNTSTAPGVQISLTPTNTPPASTVTNTPGTGNLTPTATAQLIQITATPIGTPGNLPVTGGAPGPREIAAISAGLLGLFVLVGAAWWFLLRAYLNRR